ncbi:MAG: M20/M25/M40 family metallo-hydrolase, partial [Caulobacteraceae bacterium]
MMRTVAFWACLAVALVAACFASQTPKPVAANAPASQFSAMRAFRDVQVVAARPHPTGSAEHAQVRGYLLSRMRALGLETRVQESRAFETADDAEDGRYVSGADLVNLIGLLPGRDRSLPALAVMSHYDSVPASPGAADDTTGVASALEVARAMKAGRQPARDVVFLITDGEEIGLLGARAFYRDDPLAKRIGAVINMESRGGGGRVYMFQTSARNGALIDVFRRSAVNPSSNSLATFLYANMPNDTDMTVTNQAGKIGLNYAFIGSQFDYHAASSTPANLDKGSLQHMGSQVLAATRSLADAPTLPAPAADTIYGDVLGGPIIVYPAMAGWLILLVSALLIGAAVWRARGVETLSPVGVAKGAGAGLYILLVSAVAFAAIRFATGIPRGFTDQRPLLAQFPLFEAAMALAALAVFVLSIWNLKRGARWVAAVAAPLVLAALTLFGGVQMVPLGMGVGAAVIAALVFRRAAPGWSAWTGVLLLGLILGVTLQALAPPASLVVSWPLLAASVFAAAIAFGGGGRSANPVPSLAGLVIGAAATAQMLYIVHSVVIGVGADIPSAPALFELLLALCLAPM